MRTSGILRMSVLLLGSAQFWCGIRRRNVVQAFATRSSNLPFLHHRQHREDRQHRQHRQHREQQQAHRRTFHSSTALQGIRGFRGWFESRFPQAMVKVPKTRGKGAKPAKPQMFDHVLIDMNQFLHVCLRRSESDDHALLSLMRELDDCIATTTPTKTLVLAMDGAPPCAKLATQRRRRSGNIKRSQWKIDQFPKFQHRFSPGRRKKKLRNYQGELRTICLTPGTDFMERSEDAVLYWTWQRLQRFSKSPLAEHNVAVYVSSSRIAGEGEVKLLDWITQHRAKGTIALLGGDSDLVLEGLVVPTKFTHDVFVLLPEIDCKYTCVSLWEMTRTLSSQLPWLSTQQLLYVRTDLVILLMLNGNDYLPKLNGVGNFERAMKAYFKVLRELPKTHPGPFLVDPNSLEFQLDFAITFFQAVARGVMEPGPEIQEQHHLNNKENLGLQHLSSFVDSEFLPGPIVCQEVGKEGNSDEDGGTPTSATATVTSNIPNNATNGEIPVFQRDSDDGVIDTDIDTDIDINDDGTFQEYALGEDGEGDVSEDDDDDDEEDDFLHMELLLGKPDSGDFYRYEAKMESDTTYRTARDRLAIMALEDIMGVGYVSSLGLYDRENEDDGPPTDDSTSAFDWEIKHPVEGKVDTYLLGLLWNLQTYQDGVCADFGYNYGKRHAPHPNKIVSFLKDAKENNRKVGRLSLMNGPFRSPPSAGIAGLAALPAERQHLAPEPYRSIPSSRVEDIYGACVDPVDNCFDLQQFRELVEAEGQKWAKDASEDGSDSSPESDSDDDGGSDGTTQSITATETAWTVFERSSRRVKHQYRPPKRFTPQVSRLRKNPFMTVKQVEITKYPRRRSVWETTEEETAASKLIRSARRNEGRQSKHEVRHSELDNPALENTDPLEVKYATAFGGNTDERTSSPAVWSTQPKEETPKKPPKKEMVSNAQSNLLQRMEDFGYQIPAERALQSVDGLTALACLQQLEAIDLIASMSWKYQSPSPSAFASLAPEEFEAVVLNIEAMNGTSMQWQQDRSSKHGARQLLKQHLAGVALDDLLRSTSTSWDDMNFSEMKAILKKQNDKTMKSSAKSDVNGQSDSNCEGTKGDSSTSSISNDAAGSGKHDGDVKKPPKRTPIGTTKAPNGDVRIDTSSVPQPQLSVEKQTPRYCLDAMTCIDGIEVQWVVESVGEDDMEQTRLTTTMNNRTITYVGGRKASSQSRKYLHHFLATRALEDMVGPQWRTVSLRELLRLVKQEKTA